MNNRVRTLLIKAMEKRGYQAYTVNSAQGYLAARVEPEDAERKPARKARPKNGRR